MILPEHIVTIWPVTTQGLYGTSFIYGCLDESELTGRNYHCPGSPDVISVDMQSQTGATAYFSNKQSLLFALRDCLMQRQTAVTAYFSSKQLLLFSFACQYIMPHYAWDNYYKHTLTQPLAQCQANVFDVVLKLRLHWDNIDFSQL